MLLKTDMCYQEKGSRLETVWQRAWNRADCFLLTREALVLWKRGLIYGRTQSARYEYRRKVTGIR